MKNWAKIGIQGPPCPTTCFCSRIATLQPRYCGRLHRCRGGWRKERGSGQGPGKREVGRGHPAMCLGCGSHGSHRQRRLNTNIKQYKTVNNWKTHREWTCLYKRWQPTTMRYGNGPTGPRGPTGPTGPTTTGQLCRRRMDPSIGQRTQIDREELCSKLISRWFPGDFTCAVDVRGPDPARAWHSAMCENVWHHLSNHLSNDFKCTFRKQLIKKKKCSAMCTPGDPPIPPIP